MNIDYVLKMNAVFISIHPWQRLGRFFIFCGFNWKGEIRGSPPISTILVIS